MTKKTTKTETAGKTTQTTENLKKRGQTKMWTPSDIRGKYKLTVEQGQQAIQGANLKMGKHIIGGKITKVGLMMIGKWLKANPFPEIKKAEPREDGRVIQELVVSDSKPPNKRRLWVIDPSQQHGTKMTCHVQERMWNGHHKGMKLTCEKIGEDGDNPLWTSPPLNT